MKMMMRRVLLAVCLLALCAGSLTGCGTPQVDGQVLNINPSVARVNVGGVTTIQIFLTKPRVEEGTMSIFIDDDGLVKPATQSGEVKVSKGQNMVSFDLQGIAVGRTTLRARLDGDNAVSAQIIVSNQ